MAPQRKSSRSNRSENVNTEASPSIPTPPAGGVTREELNTVVAEIHQQMATQNNEMFEKLAAMFAAQNRPPPSRVEIDIEDNAHSSASDHQENDNDDATPTDNKAGLNQNPVNPVPSNNNAHDPCQRNNQSQWRRIPPNIGGTTQGVPSQVEGVRIQSTLRDRLCQQASEKVAVIPPVELPDDEEYLSRMISKS